MKRRLLPILFLLLFALAPAAQAQVETLWSRTAPNNHPDWFGVNTERGMAYGVIDGNARVYVASRFDGPSVIRIVDADTGADVGILSSAGIEGGLFPLNDVAVSNDGVILGSNMTLDATVAANPFRVYRWDDEDAEPVRVIDYTSPDFMRLGDRVTVTGSADDNSLAIWAAAANENRIVRFTTDDEGATFSAEIITLQGIEETSIFPSVTLVEDESGDFYFNAGFGEAGIHPRLHRADGTFVAELTSIPVGTNTMRHFVVGDQAYLAVNDGVVTGEKAFSIYELSADGTAARRLVRTPSMGTEANTFGGGDFEIVVEEEGSFILYGLSSNNGIAAFRIDPAGIFEGTYYVGAEGSAPGGADPRYASLTEAFAEINDRDASGAIALLITSDLDERGSYLAVRSRMFTEAQPLTIRPAPDATPTIRVAAATSEEVGAEGAGAGILIDNTSWVTIDGSNTEGGTSRDLTIVVDDEAATRGIQVIRDAQNVTIRNVQLLVEAGTAGIVGIRVRRDDASTVVPENLLIENNQVGSEDAPFFQSIALFGNDGIGVQAEVLGNDIYASQRGITTFWVTDSRYEGNRFWMLGTAPTTSWSAAVYLALGDGITIAGNEVLGFTTNNATAQANAAFLMNANLGDVWLYNNMVAVDEFSNNGDATDAAFYAFGVNNPAGAGDHYIYHNTVRIGGSDQTGRTAAFGFFSDATLQSFTLRNNIFVNETNAENAYIYHWPIAATTLLTESHNNAYVSADAAGIALVGETRFDALSDWQFGTGLGGNSVSTEVEFVSETDLRLTGASIGDMNLAGTPLAEVEVDIDGTQRNRTAPYMGAYEGTGLVSVDDAVAGTPEALELHQNYPNPFRESTTISYTLPTSGHVTVQVYNTAGQLVHRLVDDYQTQGRQEVRFDASSLASGVYFYRVQFEGQAQSMRMVLVR